MFVYFRPEKYPKVLKYHITVYVGFREDGSVLGLLRVSILHIPVALGPCPPPHSRIDKFQTRLNTYLCFNYACMKGDTVS